jgi:molybdopterin/thiamine biosynthesis adenylyltransferase
VGRSKVEAAIAQLAALNPELTLRGLDGGSWPQAVPAADIVLDCSDNFPTRQAINATCVRARRPLVSGAAIRFEGQLAVFDLRRGGPCYHCLYPQTGESTERCEDAGILGPVVGTVGSLQALMALKLLLGIGDDTGRLQVWEAKRMVWRSHKISVDPECPVCRAPHV